jgi:hypothetical protein
MNVIIGPSCLRPSMEVASKKLYRNAKPMPTQAPMFRDKKIRGSIVCPFNKARGVGFSFVDLYQVLGKPC